MCCSYRKKFAERIGRMAQRLPLGTTVQMEPEMSTKESRVLFSDPATRSHDDLMAANKNFKNLKLTLDDGATVVDLGEMEIWDGADLALLREAMVRLVQEQHCRSLGVDMRHVKYVPSGFFGMLFDWCEKGVRIRIYSPQPHVQKMLWFKKFFSRVIDTCYELTPDDMPCSSLKGPHAKVPASVARIPVNVS